jgi:hypothetical protein
MGLSSTVHEPSGPAPQLAPHESGSGAGSAVGGSAGSDVYLEAAMAAASLVIARILTQKQIESASGVHVHGEYEQLLGHDNDAVRRLKAALPAVTKVVNDALARAGIHVTLSESELEVNFLAEGGDKVIAAARTSGIDGYEDVGIDSFIDKFEQLKTYLPDDLVAFAQKKSHQRAVDNEQGQRMHTITNMSLEQALQANASMYALALQQLTADLKTLDPPVDIATVPEQGRVFWTTLYYNAGPGTARYDLVHKGVDWYKEKWAPRAKHGEHGKHQKTDGMDARYNALSRTGSWELLDEAADEKPVNG